jgi:hypothetical protein
MPAGGAQGAIELTVTTKFMQDFEGGGRWLEEPERMATATAGYLAQDGSPHLLYFKSRIAPTFEHARRDADSSTGWRLDEAPWMADTQRTGHPPTAILFPGDTDRLLVNRTDFLLAADIAPDGSLGPLVAHPKPYPSFPVRMGNGPLQRLQRGARYLLLAVCQPSDGMTARIDRYVLGDLTQSNIYTYPVDDRAFAPGNFDIFDGMYGARVFPLADHAADRYRCIAVDRDGAVRSVTLVRDEGGFRLTQNVTLATLAPSDVLAAGGGRVHVLESVPGEVQVLLFDLPGVRTIAGRYDPATAQDIKWGALWSGALPNWQIPEHWKTAVSPGGKMQAQVLGTWNGRARAVECEVCVFAGRWETWSCTWSPDGDLTELVPTGRAVLAGALSADEPCWMAYRDQGPLRGVEVWRRNEEGDYDIDPVVLEADSEDTHELETYRVGVSLLRDNVPVAGQEIGLTASLVTAARVNGEEVMLRANSPFGATSDGNGEIWISLPLENRLTFPKLYLSSPALPSPLELHIDSEIQEHLRGLSNDALKSAVDPRSGKQVLAHQDKVEDIGNALRTAMSLAPRPEQGAQAGGVVVTSSCPWQWRSGPAHALAVSSRVSPVNAPSWVLDVTSGKPQFSMLTHDQAAQMMAEMRGHHPSIVRAKPPVGVHPMGWFDDLLDWVGDAVDAVWDGLCSVGKVLVNGVDLCVHLVMDGIDFIYNGVLDTIERVMDAVAFVLDAAGEALGVAIGWLLDQLGFLFNWSDIKLLRDDLRKAYSSGLASVVKTLPDPAELAKDVGAKLDGAKASMIAALQSLRSSPTGTQSVSTTTSISPPLSKLLAVGDASIMPQATWLMEKVQAALDRLMPDIGLPTFKDDDFVTKGTNFAAELAKYAQISQDAFTQVMPRMGDLTGLLGSWLDNPASFASSPLDPLIDLIIKCVDAAIDLIKKIAASAGALLHAMWHNPQAMIDWADTELRIPFFRGFYKGLFGNRLSAFDVACMGAAVVAYAAGARPAPRAAAHALAAQGGVAIDTRHIALGLTWGGVFTDALNSFFGAATPANTLVPTALNACFSIAPAVCGLPAGTLSKVEKYVFYDAIAVGVTGSACAILGAFPKCRTPAGDIATLLLGGYRATMLGVEVGSDDADGLAIAYTALGLSKSILNVAMRAVVVTRSGSSYQNPKGLSPVPSAIYAAVQGALGVARAGIYTDQWIKAG